MGLCIEFDGGLFNLLPIKPLDGGIIFEELLGYKLPEKFVTKIVSSVSIVLVGIVAFIIIYSIVPGIIQMI
jgi:membrane-associated protease RseP (regulator of RpoE activity)